MKVELPYGRQPYPIELGSREVQLVEAPVLSTPTPLNSLLQAALDAPFAGPSLEGADVVLIVSDPSRKEPRDALVAAIRARLPRARFTVAIATGTHGPCRIEDLGLSPESLRDATIINHDGHQDHDLVELGTTARGTPIRVHRCLVETDLIVATGCIRPHYFAGFGAGVKALFPGLGQAAAIRVNHRLKTEPNARAGIVDGNPCREDLEEAVHAIERPIFLLNGVCAPDDRVHAAVAGDVGLAFRAGVERARPWFTVRARPSKLVIASDGLPVTASLYQAAKIAAASAPLVAPGGTLAVVAECPDGIGPLATVNEAIFRIGVLPRLAPGVRLVLISGLGEAETKKTLLEFAPSIDAVLASTSSGEPVTVIPRASQLICEASS